MAEAFEILGRDHREVRRVLAELEEGPTAASGADEAQLLARTKAVQQLIIDESGHEAAEEQHFWPTVRDLLPDGDYLADEAIEQEQAAKEVLAVLDRLSAGDAEFEPMLAAFTIAARAHIAFEETQVWPGLREVITHVQLEVLADDIAEAKKRGPTRPHPGVPASPDVLRRAGPAVAAADRLRDRATGRGER